MLGLRHEFTRLPTPSPPNRGLGSPSPFSPQWNCIATSPPRLIKLPTLTVTILHDTTFNKPQESEIVSLSFVSLVDNQREGYRVTVH